MNAICVKCKNPVSAYGNTIERDKLPNGDIQIRITCQPCSDARDGLFVPDYGQMPGLYKISYETDLGKGNGRAPGGIYHVPPPPKKLKKNPWRTKPKNKKKINRKQQNPWLKEIEQRHKAKVKKP